MKPPSNRMPKHIDDEYEKKWYYPVVLWMFIILFLLGVIYLAYSNVYSRYIILALVLYMAIRSAIDSKKQKKIIDSRKSWGIGCFAKEFDLKRVDTWVIRAVYEAIYDLVELPIKADDEIYNDLGIDFRELEFEEILINVSERTNRVLPGGEDRYNSVVNIKTVKDLVEFFNNLPRKRIKAH